MHKDFFVARQPIFDKDQNLWGFELLFRDGLTSEFANFDDPTQATVSVASCGFLAATADIPENVRMFINFTEDSILKRIPLALPAPATVVEILEDVPVTPGLIERVIELKNEGYILALDDFAGDDSYLDIMEYVDIIKLDCLEGDMREIVRLKQKFSDTSCMFLAEKVDSESMFEELKQHGIDLFQGYYFARPQVMKGRKLSSQHISQLRLASAIERDELDMETILDAIKTDVSLSYRLLRYINSAAFSFRNKIGSIKQALTLLGFNKIRHWLRLILYSDMVSSRVNPEILRMALQRAYFLDAVGEHLSQRSVLPERLFMVGMFSLLDVMLNTPMENVLEGLPLSDEIKGTLMGRDTPMSDYIALAQAVECGNFELADSLGGKQGLSEKVIASSFQAAIMKSDELVAQLNTIAE